MEKVIVSIPAFMSVIAFYFYFLEQPKQKNHRFVPYILTSTLFETAYFTYLYTYSSDFTYARINAFPLSLLTLSILFFFLYEIIENRPLKKIYIVLNLLPVTFGLAAYIVERAGLEEENNNQTKYWGQYIMIVLSILSYLVIFVIKIRQRIINDHNVKLFSVILAIQLVLLVTLLSLFLGFILFLKITFFLFSIIEIIVTVTLYFYLVENYKHKLEYEKRKRFEVFSSLSRLPSMRKMNDTNSFKPVQPEKREKVSNTGRYEKSLLRPDVLKEYENRVIVFFENEQKHYLNVNFDMQKLSQITQIPIYHLSQVFSIALKTSFHQYLSQKRIAFACALLKEHGNAISVVSLCDMCGYSSRSSFYQQFKNITGYTLTAYRKNNY